MFHACGWTFPWAITASFATQITLRTVNVSTIWYHLLKSGVTHYCAAPTVQVRGSSRLLIRTVLMYICFNHQISLLNAPEARNVPNVVTTIIAGSAPTAKLIEDLEQKGINPVHVYGLT